MYTIAKFDLMDGGLLESERHDAPCLKGHGLLDAAVDMYLRGSTGNVVVFNDKNQPVATFGLMSHVVPALPELATL